MCVMYIFVVQAEREHDRKVKKKELARQQGEGTWMLQSVDERIKHEEEVHTRNTHHLLTAFFPGQPG